MDNNNYKLRSMGASTAERTEAEADARTFMNRVYNWMAGGLAITGIISYLVYQVMMESRPVADAYGNTVSGGSIFWSSGFMLMMILLEFGLVMWISVGINKMAPATAGICFLLYAAINGVTLAPIFMVYTESTIYTAFFTCAGTFAVTSLVGYITKMDLSGIGSFCMMGLIGLIIASVVNMFVQSSGFDKFLTYIGVALFVGLTVWDTQKLKQAGEALDGMERTSAFHKYAILGALNLYLDFVNLFLLLLRLFGRRD